MKVQEAQLLENAFLTAVPFVIVFILGVKKFLDRMVLSPGYLERMKPSGYQLLDA